MLAGDPANERAEAKGNIKGDIFGCPDGLWFDARGVLWIQTDMLDLALDKGELATSATTRCWPATRAAARCGAS